MSVSARYEASLELINHCLPYELTNTSAVEPGPMHGNCIFLGNFAVLHQEMSQVPLVQAQIQELSLVG